VERASWSCAEVLGLGRRSAIGRDGGSRGRSVGPKKYDVFYLININNQRKDKQPQIIPPRSQGVGNLPWFSPILKWRKRWVQYPAKTRELSPVGTVYEGASSVSL